MAKPLPVIDVNQFGRDAEGNEFGWAATPEAVNEGLMRNRRVLLRFPDGLLIESVQAFVTPKGLDYFRRTMPIEDRDVAGTA